MEHRVNVRLCFFKREGKHHFSEALKLYSLKTVKILAVSLYNMFPFGLTSSFARGFCTSIQADFPALNFLKRFVSSVFM